MDGSTGLSVVIVLLSSHDEGRRTTDEGRPTTDDRERTFIKVSMLALRWLARNQLDLDARPTWQRGHRHSGARGVGRFELARIDRVHRLEIADVGQVNIALD